MSLNNIFVYFFCLFLLHLTKYLAFYIVKSSLIEHLPRAFLFALPFISPSIHLPTHPSLHLSISPPIISPHILLPIHPFIHLSMQFCKNIPGMIFMQCYLGYFYMVRFGADFKFHIFYFSSIISLLF